MESTDSASPTEPIGYELRQAQDHPAAIALGTVGLRLFGVWWAVQAILAVPYLFTLMNANTYFGSDRYALTPTVVTICLQLAVATLVLFGARPIARIVFGQHTITPVAVSLDGWMTVVVSGVGLTMIAMSLDTAIQAGLVIAERLTFNLRRGVPASPVEATEAIRLLMPLAKVAVGLLLFLRPRILVGRWVQHAHPPAQDLP